MKKGMFRSVFILIVSLLFINPVLDGKSSGKINIKGFPQLVEKMLQEWEVMGAAVAIVKDGKVVFAGGFGYRDFKNKLKVTPDTLFAIGSCSKAFTATVLGILEDEGKLEWDNPVRNYLPSFKLQDTLASEQMTPIDLVTHRSGLPRHDLIWYGSSATREELFNRLQFLESSKGFRSTYQYNNLMYMTAGYMAGKIAGKSWEELVKQKIFDPLGMKTSNFSVKDLQESKDFSLPYSKREEKIQKISYRNLDAIGPAGSINSSVNEMVQWILLNLNKGKFGEKQIISRGNLQKIHSPQMVTGETFGKDKEFLYASYGMGWRIMSYRGHPLLVHGGGIDGFISRVSFLPRDNAGVVVLTNTDTGGSRFCSVITYNVADRILGLPGIPWSQRLKKRDAESKKKAEERKKKGDTNRKPNTTPSHPMEDYTGEYKNPGYGILKIEKEGSQLKAALNTLHFNIRHYHYDIFELSSEISSDRKIKAHFYTDVNGNINRISIPIQRGVKPIEFTRLPEKKEKKDEKSK